MKKLTLYLLFVLFYSTILQSYTVEKTLSQIESLKKELAHNEQIVEDKISNLKKNNPLFAEQDVFESDIEYLSRMSKAIPQLEQLRKQYLGDLWQKMSILRSRLFETQNIKIDLDTNNYDPNTEKWQVTVEHLAYQKEKFTFVMNITKSNANELYKNWAKVKKQGMLAIDVGDKIGLAKLYLENPITGYKFDFEFQPLMTFKHSHYIYSVAFSPDGKFLATGSYERASIWNLETGNKVKEFEHYDYVNSVAFSPDGKFLATGSGSRARTWNLETGNKVKEFEQSNNVNSVAFSPDGKFLAAGSWRRAMIYNLETGKKVKNIEHSNYIYSVAFSPDGKFLATGSYERASIWNLETGNKVKEFMHSKSVNSVVFSPDGKFLATGSYERASIWNLETGNKVKEFKHSEAVSSVAFSPDGKFLATGSGYENRGDTRIYNLETGNKVKEFKHSDYVSSVAFSPDGMYLATGSIDNRARIYRTFFQPEEELLAEKMISTPPALSASVNFIEPSGNNYLDALEVGEIKLTLTNSGEGAGKGINIKFDPERIEGLNYNNSYIDEIAAGESVTEIIPIEAYIDVKDETHKLNIEFDELNGFPPNSAELEFSTKSYEKPKLFVSDVGFEDGNSNGKIESGEMIELTVRFANKGKGIATGSYANFFSGNDVFITDSYPKMVSLGDLDYGEFKDVQLEFFVNDRTVEEIPLFVKLTEATNLATVDNLRIPILKSDKTRKIQKTVITGIDKDYDELNWGDDLSIDIEQNIPQTTEEKEGRIAIIFGIEDYKNVSNVTFAHRDANFIKEYFDKTLGLKEKNIYFRANADVTKAEFDKVFSEGGWLDKRVKAGESEILFYYAGHGAPDLEENAAYLIPYDGDPNYASQTGYKLAKIYDDLAKLNARSVTVFLDACFSGANRENEMLLADARPLMMEVNSPAANGITVFSATSSKQISSAWPQQKHGLFSYFLMKGMQGKADANKDHKLSIKELGDYLENKVKDQARYLDREQTPQLITDDDKQILINY